MAEVLGEMTAEPGAVERMYEVYGLFEALAEAVPDDPRVARAAQALADCVPDAVAAELAGAEVPGTARENGFLAAFHAQFTPAQAAAVRGAVRLITERAR
jgi:hypothetical protein